MMAEVTLKDIARLAGVSTAAISQALNDRGNLRPETRERIKGIAAELGYAPNKAAAALRSGRTMSVGLVVAAPDAPPPPPRTTRRASRLMSTLVGEAAENRFTVTLLPESRPDLLRGAPVDLLYFPAASAGHPVLREAIARSIPVVADDRYLDAARGMTLRTGYDDAVSAGLDLLETTGAQRIGLLIDDEREPHDEIGLAAYLAWSAVRDRHPLVGGIDPGRRTLARSVRDLVDRGADAIFAFCEEGPDVFVQLENIDRVIPRDLQLVALCTADCAANARLGVTRVCLHPERAAEALFASLHRLSGDETSLVVDLPWELVRGSTTR